MRIGVVGYGKWGRRVVKKLEPRKIVGVAVNEPAGRCAPPDFVEGIERLVALKPTHVFVLSPIALLAQHAEIAWNAGAHVFVEKPFTYDSDTLSDFSNRLKNSQNQRLHVNHLYRYSDLLKQVNLDGVRTINLHWEKHSSSPSTIAENLLSHDISILLTLFGSNSIFSVRSKVSDADRFVVEGKMNNVAVRLSYLLRPEPSFRQIKYLELSRTGSRLRIDLLKEPADKLARSLGAFFSDSYAYQSDSFSFHLRLAEIMRSIISYPTEVG